MKSKSRFLTILMVMSVLVLTAVTFTASLSAQEISATNGLPGIAADTAPDTDSGDATGLSASASGSARYFVILADPSAPNYTGGIEGLAATNPAARGEIAFNIESADSKAYVSYLEAQQANLLAEASQQLGRTPEVVYQLQYALNAVVMVLDPAEAALVAKLPGVVQVERDTAEEIDTDFGPTWIGAPTIWDGTSTGGLPGTKGEGIIIGVLDTGINMDHPSFADIGGDGYNHTNPFGSGNFKGWCDPTNPNYDPAYVCNDKLVGAWDYADASWGEPGGPEDTDGHGSHTASTSGGNYLAPGTVDLGAFPYSPAISGVAPHANIIAYDVCGTSCNTTDVVAALNQAIADGVDVTNESIGISGNSWTGSKQAAYLSVFNAGITSARSAGNSGPASSTVGSTPPWVITVGANTHNRAGDNAVINLTGGSTTPPGGGTLNGLGLSGGSAVASIVYAGNAPYSDALCLNPFASGSVTGLIVICDRGTNARVAKGFNVLQGGAAGMILVNTSAGQSLNGDIHHLPAVHIGDVDGAALKAWVNSGTGHQGQIAGTTLSFDASNGDVMAGFSSRGPHPIANLLTPDVTNPGVDILAAYRSGSITADNPTVEYAMVSGTSMSSPHTAGSAALIKALHPTWTPAEIKSALMNTGKFTGILKEDGVTPAIPFDMGTGRVDLTQAGNTGLVFNEIGANFTAANPDTGGDPKALNLASLANASCAGACNWARTVKATRAGTWTASYITPAGMTLQVTPNNFTLTDGQTQSLSIQANVAGLTPNVYAFGYIVLTESVPGAGSTVHMTVVVRPIEGQATIGIEPASLAATQPADTTTSETLVISNTGTVPLTWNIAEGPVATRLELTLNDEDAPKSPDAPLSLMLDDGMGENAIGVGGSQFLWLNRFTPDAGSFPIQLDQVDVMFGYPASTGGINVGELVDIYLYEDADGNPANGATIVGSLLNQAVEAVNGTTWSTFPLAAPLTFNGPGDILIAVVNRTAGVTAGTFPAAIDQTPTSQLRSWAGFGVVPGNPPTLPLPTFGIIDSFGAEFAGNWMVRGFGEQTSACDSPADVPWLSVTPSNGVTAAGGSANVTVTYNSTGLALGDYSAVLCVTSDDPSSPLVEVPVSLSVVAGAEIDVDPLILTSTQSVDSTTVQSLSISNTGEGDLDWEVIEDVELALELVDWSDNFDSYATGSQLHGQGGWKGWFNDPLAGAMTSSDQAQSAPNSAAIVGGSDLVHEYSGYTSGQWTYTAWQYIPTNYTGESSFILLNTYNDAGTGLNWSVQVTFDGAANQVVNDGLAGGTLALIKGQWVELRVEIDLNGDTQSFFYNNQLLYQGSWTGGVSGGGALNIGAVDLFANSASVVYYDDLSLVDATAPVACDAVNDIPWASVSPTSGTTVPGDTSDVDVTFDSTGLAAGTYTANLCVTSNDADPGPGNGTELVIVPLELVVEEAVYGVEIAPPTAVQTDTVGATITYTLTITNNGNVADTFDLAVSGNTYTTTFSAASIALDAGDSGTVMVYVTIPANASDGDSDVATVTATSQGDPTESATATLTTMVDVPEEEMVYIFLPIIHKP